MNFTGFHVPNRVRVAGRSRCARPKSLEFQGTMVPFDTFQNEPCQRGVNYDRRRFENIGHSCVNAFGRGKAVTRDFLMRTLPALALLAVGVLVQAQPSSAQSPYDYPWCALRGDRSGAQSCYFTSYRQCMASLRRHRRHLHPQPVSDPRTARAVSILKTPLVERHGQHSPATVSRPSCSTSTRSALVNRPVE